APFQLVPDFGGAEKQRQVAVEGINLQISNNCDDRIAAVIHAFDVNYWRRTRSRGIVTGPFAKRSLGPRFDIGRRHLTLQNDFRMAENRQAGMLPGNNLKWPASDVTGEVIF